MSFPSIESFNIVILKLILKFLSNIQRTCASISMHYFFCCQAQEQGQWMISICLTILKSYHYSISAAWEIHCIQNFLQKSQWNWTKWKEITLWSQCALNFFKNILCQSSVEVPSYEKPVKYRRMGKWWHIGK